MSLIRQRNQNFKQPDLQKWASHVDKMIRIDKRTPEDLEKVIQWCQTDTFWQNNIFETMATLHERNQPIDLMNLRYCLKETDTLNTVDNVYLATLEDVVPHSLSFGFYANEILRLFNNRQKSEAAGANPSNPCVDCGASYEVVEKQRRGLSRSNSIRHLRRRTF